MTGRTIWLAQDAQRHRRSLMVELKAEHGAVAIACDTVLCAHAKLQNNSGFLRDGFATIADEAGCSRDEARTFIEAAAAIGWLDDLEVDPDGRRFLARISGWDADQEKGRAAWRQAARRADLQEEQTVTESDMSRSVAESHLTGQDRTGQKNSNSTVELAELDQARSRLKSEQTSEVFTTWVESTGRDPAKTKLTPDRRRRIEKALASHGLDDCLAAVRHIGADSWARGNNDRRRRFDDIEHALGNSERLERWRDQTPRPASPVSPADQHQATRQRRSAALASLVGGDPAA